MKRERERERERRPGQSVWGERRRTWRTREGKRLLQFSLPPSSSSSVLALADASAAEWVYEVLGRAGLTKIPICPKCAP